MSPSPAADNQIKPPVKTLLRGSAISALAAAVIFTAFILPAEFGADPLRTGALFGIKDLSSSDDSAVSSDNAATAGRFGQTMDGPPRTEEYQIFLVPGADLEFKLNIEAETPVHYTWQIEGEPVIYDLHGEPFDGPDGCFESYDEGRSAGASGWFVTPFAGTHGWYLNNDGAKLAIFRATVTGYFEEIE